MSSICGPVPWEQRQQSLLAGGGDLRRASREGAMTVSSRDVATAERRVARICHVARDVDAVKPMCSSLRDVGFNEIGAVLDRQRVLREYPPVILLAGSDQVMTSRADLDEAVSADFRDSSDAVSIGSLVRERTAVHGNSRTVATSLKRRPELVQGLEDEVAHPLAMFVRLEDHPDSGRAFRDGQPLTGIARALGFQPAVTAHVTAEYDFEDNHAGRVPGPDTAGSSRRPRRDRAGSSIRARRRVTHRQIRAGVRPGGPPDPAERLILPMNAV